MLHTLKPNEGSTHSSRRVARGNGSGRGTTGGRGQKGQQSRTGKGRRLGFEGGQTPLIRRQPKLGGFTHPRRVNMEPLNLDVLEKRVEAGSYDVAALKALRIVSGRSPVKLLGRGAITKKLTLTVNAASKSAKAAVEKAGGSVTIVHA
jgi:large subunit ribosomal protein L15